MSTVQRMAREGPVSWKWTVGGKRVLDEPAMRGPDGPLVVDAYWHENGKGHHGYALNIARVRDMDEAELIAAVVQAEPQPSELELRLLYGVWSKTPPTAPDFEGAYQRFVNAARRAGWGLSPKARAATAAGREKKTMTAKITLRPDERLDASARTLAHNYGMTYEEGLKVTLEQDPALAGQYLPISEPKPAPMVAPTPWSQASVEADRRAKAYSAKHEVSYDIALGVVFQQDPQLRRDYLRPPVAVKVHGLISETEAETLLHGLSEAELLELAIERKLGEPGLSGQQQDAVAQISLYDWLISTGGYEHGSREAAAARDRLWNIVVRERFKRHGLSQPPGR